MTNSTKNQTPVAGALEKQLESIVDHKHVHGVSLWPYFGQGYLGALLDKKMAQIPGSVPWNPLPTVQEVLDSLERAAVTLRKRDGAVPTITLVMSDDETP